MSATKGREEKEWLRSEEREKKRKLHSCFTCWLLDCKCLDIKGCKELREKPTEEMRKA